MQTTIIVVPCYNEASRLDGDAFLSLLDNESIKLLFVDDGSSDSTLGVLTALAEQAPERISVLPLHPNRGKGEAVRQGLLQALESEPQQVAFVDADLATPISEILRLANIANDSDADAIIGARIAYLGANIARSQGRHLLGRVFATAASLALDAPIYDTQCGAKFFRNSSLLRDTLADSFHSRWAFDVELLGRIMAEGGQVIEVPLQSWADVPGSKVSLRSMLKAGLDLLQVRSHLRNRPKK